MKVSGRLIISLALISLLLSLAAIYLNSQEYSRSEQSAVSQFGVGLTVRPAKNQTTHKKFQKFFDFFRKF